MTVRPLRDRLWRKRLRAIERAWTAARDGEPDAVHQLRVGSRRIREALPLMGDTDRPNHLKRMRRTVRDLTQTLGPVRERDVSLRLLSALEEDHPADRAAIQLVRQMLTVERKDFHEELEKHLDALPLKKLVKKLTRAAKRSRKSGNGRKEKTIGVTADERRWRTALAIQVARRAKQLRQAIEHAGALYAPDRLHGVRVTTKKLRYALELGRGGGMGRWSPAIRSLTAVQDILGQLGDREALLERLRAFDASRGSLLASESLDRLTRLLEEEARQYHAKFVHHRERLLKLCATIRQQASHALPIGRPAPRRIAEVSRRGSSAQETTARRASAR